MIACLWCRKRVAYFKGGRGVLVIIPVASWHHFLRNRFCAHMPRHILSTALRNRNIVSWKCINRFFKNQDIFLSEDPSNYEIFITKDPSSKTSSGFSIMTLIARSYFIFRVRTYYSTSIPRPPPQHLHLIDSRESSPRRFWLNRPNSKSKRQWCGKGLTLFKLSTRGKCFSETRFLRRLSGGFSKYKTLSYVELHVKRFSYPMNSRFNEILRFFEI